MGININPIILNIINYGFMLICLGIAITYYEYYKIYKLSPKNK